MRSTGRDLSVGFVCGMLIVAGVSLLALPVAALPASASSGPVLVPSVAVNRTFHPSLVLPSLPSPATVPSATSASPRVSSPSAASGVAPAASGTSSPVVGETWTGLGATDNGYLTPYPAVSPPDVQMAVGPNHVVEMVNFAVSMWTKQHLFVRNESLMSFFNVPTNEFISDPKVQYDAASGRWFATITDVATGSNVATGQVLLAISGSSDPTGSWRIIGVPSTATGECLDQPILGVGVSTVIVSVNVFSTCLSNKYTYNGAQYWVLGKADLVAGVVSPAIESFGPYANTASFHPAQMIGTGAADYLVSANANLNSVSTLEFFRVTGTPPSVNVQTSNLSVRTITNPPAAPQPGGSKVLPLDTGDFRVQDAVWSDGNLWLSLGDGCTPSGDTHVRSCVRLVEINTTTGTVAQDFDVGSAGLYYLYPALRADAQGDLLVVFGYSSASVFPGLMAAGRVFGDAPGSLDPPQAIMAGTASETLQCSTTTGTCRYGDYFGAALDPSNASVVWAAGEFGSPSGWRTQIFSGAVKAVLTLDYNIVYGGSGYTPPQVAYTLDGAARTATLSLAPTSYAVDPGTAWSVTQVLTSPGSTSGSEIWALNGVPLSSFVNASVTENLTYFHRYFFDFGFSVSDHSAATTPMIRVQSWGIQSWVPAGLSRYADAGSPFAYPSLLNGSTSQERWMLEGPANGTVTGPSAFAGMYAHQYQVSFDYAVQGGSAAAAPVVQYVSLGADTSATANATVWADGGRAYAYPVSLTGGNGLVRMGAGPGAAGNVTSAGTITVTYRLQYLLSVSVEPGALAGAVSGSGWYDTGSVATLTASAPSGWKFIGWSDAASGAESSTTLAMTGPANVTALFYPGLTIVAGDGGSVAYAYGSVSGVVPAGSSATLYAPIGTTVTLTAQPSSWTSALVSWGGGASGSAASTTVALSGPRTVSAAFGMNALVVVGIAGGVLAVLLAILLLVLVTRRRKKQPPA